MVSAPALCLVLILPLLAGFPTSNPLQGTIGSTTIELLTAGDGGNKSTVEAINTTAELTNEGHANDLTDSLISSTFATVVSNSSNKPVVHPKDRIGVEYDKSKPALHYFQTLLVDVLQPKPLLDTIREEEKYGNEGDNLSYVGRGFVEGVAKLTNFISSAVDLPYEALKSITRKATETLNNIGGKIVGI